MDNQIKLILSSGQTPERALSGIFTRYTREANERLRRRKLDPNQKYCLSLTARKEIKDDLAAVVDRLLIVKRRGNEVS